MKWKKENNLPKLTGPNGDDLKCETDRSDSPGGHSTTEKDSVTSSSTSPTSPNDVTKMP